MTWEDFARTQDALEMEYRDIFRSIETLYRKIRRKTINGKNLIITRIYLPEIEWKRLEKHRVFRRNVQGKTFYRRIHRRLRKGDPRYNRKDPWIWEDHIIKPVPNLGGIPVVKTKDEEIRIDTEIVEPRKRKQKATVYVKTV